jgi:hypothetical protein
MTSTIKEKKKSLAGRQAKKKLIPLNTFFILASVGTYRQRSSQCKHIKKGRFHFKKVLFSKLSFVSHFICSKFEIWNWSLKLFISTKQHEIQPTKAWKYAKAPFWLKLIYFHLLSLLFRLVFIISLRGSFTSQWLSCVVQYFHLILFILSSVSLPQPRIVKFKIAVACLLCFCNQPHCG